MTTDAWPRCSKSSRDTYTPVRSAATQLGFTVKLFTGTPELVRSARVGAWTAAVLMLAACGGSGSLDVQVHGEVTALVATDSEHVLDAEVRGVIERGPGGCLGLLAEDADAVVPLIWPEGSQLAEDGTRITVPELGEVRVGQNISGGGGQVSSTDGDRYSDVPEDCLDQGLLFDVASIGSVTD